MVVAVWLPMTWAQTIVNASHWVGLTFPGMILLPGSFSGRANSPRPQRGPEPRYLISWAILNRDEARVLSEPEAWTIASCAARDSNLLGAVLNSVPVILLTSAAIASANPLKVL